MTLQTDYSKAFSYARMQNGMPAVRSVVLRNPGKDALTEMQLSIRFDPAFSEGHASHISELAPKGKLILDHIKVLPSATYLANLTERVEGRMTVSVTAAAGECGRMTVSVTAAAGECAREEYPVALLPYDFWEGVNDAPELTAAFVLPNHPAIRPVLHAASERLGKWTGSPSLDGYQSGDVNRDGSSAFSSLWPKPISIRSPSRIQSEICSSRFSSIKLREDRPQTASF